MSEQGETAHIDFSKQPTEIYDYVLGGQVTRENFASMLIQSFAFSKGSFGRQETFFRWIQENTGWNYEMTLSRFLDAGGWDTFSDEEKKHFFTDFDRIRDHKDKHKSTILRFHSNPANQLRQNLPNRFYSESRVEREEYEDGLKKFIQLYGPLSGMTYRDLVRNMGKFKGI